MLDLPYPLEISQAGGPGEGWEAVGVASSSCDKRIVGEGIVLYDNNRVSPEKSFVVV